MRHVEVTRRVSVGAEAQNAPIDAPGELQWAAFAYLLFFAAIIVPSAMLLVGRITLATTAFWVLLAAACCVTAWLDDSWNT